MSKYDFTNIENQIDMTESQLEDEINRYRGQSNKTSTLLTIFGILFLFIPQIYLFFTNSFSLYNVCCNVYQRDSKSLYHTFYLFVQSFSKTFYKMSSSPKGRSKSLRPHPVNAAGRAAPGCKDGSDFLIFPNPP